MSFGMDLLPVGIMKQFRVHVKDCESTPESLKVEYKRLKKPHKTRGRKQSWPDTARSIGLVEMQDENGPSGITYVSTDE